MNAELSIRIKEQAELRTIQSLTSVMKQREIAEMRKVRGRRDKWGEVGNELDNISPIYQITSLYDCLIGCVQVSCTRMKDIDDI